MGAVRGRVVREQIQKHQDTVRRLCDFLSISTNRYTMSPKEIPWDKSRMEWKPVDMTVTYNGDGEFTASTGKISFPMEAPIGMGGHGKIPNPIQYLIGSLGGCVGVKIRLLR